MSMKVGAALIMVILAWNNLPPWVQTRGRDLDPSSMRRRCVHQVRLLYSQSWRAVFQRRSIWRRVRLAMRRQGQRLQVQQQRRWCAQGSWSELSGRCSSWTSLRRLASWRNDRCQSQGNQPLEPSCQGRRQLHVLYQIKPWTTCWRLACEPS